MTSPALLVVTGSVSAAALAGCGWIVRHEIRWRLRSRRYRGFIDTIGRRP